MSLAGIFDPHHQRELTPDHRDQGFECRAATGGTDAGPPARRPGWRCSRGVSWKASRRRRILPAPLRNWLRPRRAPRTWCAGERTRESPADLPGSSPGSTTRLSGSCRGWAPRRRGSAPRIAALYGDQHRARIDRIGDVEVVVTAVVLVRASSNSPRRRSPRPRPIWEYESEQARSHHLALASIRRTVLAEINGTAPRDPAVLDHLRAVLDRPRGPIVSHGGAGGATVLGRRPWRRPAREAGEKDQSCSRCSRPPLPGCRARRQLEVGFRLPGWIVAVKGQGAVDVDPVGRL